MNRISVSMLYDTVDVIYSPTYEELRIEARAVLLYIAGSLMSIMLHGGDTFANYKLALEE